jgi:hypothetical protein
MNFMVAEFLWYIGENVGKSPDLCSEIHEEIEVHKNECVQVGMMCGENLVICKNWVLCRKILVFRCAR